MLMLASGRVRRLFAMQTFLTLVIAVGGIATGVGAIWAALVARRQAQVTERSLAQTERSLSEQAQNFREQNERARLTLEYDLLSRLQGRAMSPYFLSCRRVSAKYLLDNASFEGDDMAEPPQSLPGATFEMCNFFEDVGELLRLGVLRAEPVWNRFRVWAQAYWLLCKPSIKKMREEGEDPAAYEHFEYLYRVMADLDRKRDIAAPTQ
jgi:hypothetical protein